MECPTVVYIRPRGYPIISIDHLPISLAFLHSGDLACNPSHIDPPQEVVYYASLSGTNLQKIACPSLVCPAQTIELQSTARSYPKAPQGVTQGVRSDSKHRQVVRQVGGVSLIQASSMVITSKCKIALRPETMFCFGTISSIADEEGTLHHVADPSKKKLSSEISREARAEQRVAPSPASQAKMTSYKPKVGSSPIQKTPLSTSPTKEWTWSTRKKEANVPSQGTRTRRAIFLTPPPSKEDGKKSATGGDWSHHPSPTMIQSCKGKNLPNVRHDDGGTDVETCGDITRLGNGIRRSLYPGTKLQK
jgi:hypothetical protein